MAQDDKPKTDERSAGAVLREARESAGMSIEQVADKLYLLQSVVSSLEKDCYDRIRGDTFVRGYMRNYARLLGLDAEELLRRYQGGKSRSERRGEARAKLRKRELPRTSGVGRVGMVLLLLAVSALYLFQSRAPQPAQPAAGAIVVTVETPKGQQLVPLRPVPATD